MIEGRPSGPGPMDTRSATAIILVCFALATAIVFLLAMAGRDWLGNARRYLRERASPPTVAAVSAPARRSPAVPTSSNSEAWITVDDYPPSAIRAGEQGTVNIRWSVDEQGRATRCAVVKTSGHASLDAAACRAILRSARYARVAPGTPMRSFTRRVRWMLPDS